MMDRIDVDYPNNFWCEGFARYTYEKDNGQVCFFDFDNYHFRHSDFETSEHFKMLFKMAINQELNNNAYFNLF